MKEMFLKSASFVVSCRSFVNLTNELVISESNRIRTVKLLNTLKPSKTSRVNPKRRAAVLVPLCIVNDEISLLLTVRSMRLKTNRGQVAFPGGMEDTGDKSLTCTALRETQEEIGIAVSEASIWGPGPSIGREDMIVTPYIGFIGTIDPAKLKLNNDEVERAFAVPLSEMCEPNYFGTTRFRSKHGHYTLPVFTTPKFRIWGLTAIIAHTMLAALLPTVYKNHVDGHVLVSQKLPKVVFAAGTAVCIDWSIILS